MEMDIHRQQLEKVFLRKKIVVVSFFLKLVNTLFPLFEIIQALHLFY